LHVLTVVYTTYDADHPGELERGELLQPLTLSNG
jgi:hypothetical protein